MKSVKGNILKKKMLQELSEQWGIVKAAAQNAGIARKTHYQWLKEDPEYKELVDSIQEDCIDHVESKLKEKMDGIKVRKSPGSKVVYDVPPSDTALIFYLKCKAKHRGYVDKMILDHQGVSFTPIPLKKEDLENDEM